MAGPPRPRARHGARQMSADERQKGAGMTANMANGGAAATARLCFDFDEDALLESHAMSGKDPWGLKALAAKHRCLLLYTEEAGGPGASVRVLGGDERIDAYLEEAAALLGAAVGEKGGRPPKGLLPGKRAAAFAASG